VPGSDAVHELLRNGSALSPASFSELMNTNSLTHLAWSNLQGFAFNCSPQLVQKAAQCLILAFQLLFLLQRQAWSVCLLGRCSAHSPALGMLESGTEATP